MKNPVIIKGNKYGITVILDQNLPFEELKEAVAAKFRESAKFFGNAQMAASFEGRKLSDKEEREILDVISENSDFRIICIIDPDAEKEELFKKSLNARLNELSAQNGQFYKGTLRSGQVLEAENSVVVLGDVNPGAKVISSGNVIVLGALKGIVYAGAAGNESAFVAALEMNPMQIRIADIIGRSKDTNTNAKTKTRKVEKEAKIAFVDEGYIYMEPLNRNAIKYLG